MPLDPLQLIIVLLFGKSQKRPSEVAHNLKNALKVLERKDSKREDKVLEEIVRWLQVYEGIFHGSDGQMNDAAQVAELAQETYYSNVLVLLVHNMDKLDFETKKRVASIFGHLLRRKIGTRFPTVEYLCARYDILLSLLSGYGSSSIALTCGIILRDCIRHEDLAKIVLSTPLFYDLFKYAQVFSFDIASDAFSTFKDLLTRHRKMCAKFLEENYIEFFSNYRKLLCSENYVTRRQSLKLLGELLLDRQNFEIMMRFISETENLKLIMNMLREKSRSIQYEAFHVFKIFVANPKKTKPVAEILFRNKKKLLQFFGDFQNDRKDDQQFIEEKAFLIKQVEEMQPAKNQ